MLPPPLNANLVVAVLSMLGGVASLFVGFSAKTKLIDSLVAISKSVNQLSAVFNALPAQVNTVNTTLQFAKNLSSTPAMSSCNITKTFGESISNLGSTFEGLPNITMDFSSYAAMIDSTKPLINNAITYLFVPTTMFTMLFGLAGVLLQLRLLQVKGLAAKILHAMHLCGFLSWLVLAALFAVSIIMFVLGTLLADVCYKDPVPMLTTIFAADTAISYLFTCAGDPGSDMAMLASSIQRLEDIASNMQGFLVLVRNSPYPNCTNTSIVRDADIMGPYPTGLKGNLEIMAQNAARILDVYGCKSFNQLLSSIMYDGVCYNLQGAFYYAWLGLLVGGICSLTASINFLKIKRFSSAAGGVVAPEDVIEKARNEVLKKQRRGGKLVWASKKNLLADEELTKANL